MRHGPLRTSSLPFRAGFLITLFLAVSAATRAERLPVKAYTSADGLGSSAIFDITRDARGFLWIASRDGLIRFDGYRFITYRVGGPEADPAIFKVLAARNGVYWINLNTGPDYRFVSNSQFTTIEPLPQLSSQNDLRVPLNAERVDGIPTPDFEDRSGNLWTGGRDGLYLIKEVNGRFVAEHIEFKLPSLSEKNIRGYTFHEGEDRSLWAGTYGGDLLRRLPDGRIIHFTLSPGGQDPILSLTEDRDGRIWLVRADSLIVLKPEPLSALNAFGDSTSRKVVSRNGRVDNNGQPQLPERHGDAVIFAPKHVLRRDARKETAPSGRQDSRFYRLLHASDDRIYISTNRGLVVFNSGRFQHYANEHGFHLDLGDAIAEDGEGNIWLGGNAGLVRLNPKGLTTFGPNDGLADPTVRSIYETRAGELLLVTDDWSVSIFRDGVFKSARLALPEDSTPMWRSNIALLDSRGELWVATQQKLYRYSGFSRIEELAGRRPSASYSRRDGLSGDGIFCIFEDSKSDLWISTMQSGTTADRGLTRWARATGKFQAFTAAEGFPTGRAPSAFVEDRSGGLWFGLVHGGLLRYRDGRFTQIGTQGGPQAPVTDLHLDRMGRLWIASSQDGLSRIDQPEAEHPGFRSYTVANGLTSNNLRCIAEDDQGDIYVGTARGVDRLSPETDRVNYYGVEDGLAADFVHAAYHDRHGALWFGTANGLSRLVPEPQKSSSPPVLISGLRIAGIDYAVSPLGQTAVLAPELSANQNNLQIDFSSISVGAAGSLRYQYKLEGADPEWSAPTTQRAVTYASLSPGAYRFLVRAISPSGGVSPQPAVVSFRILPPVWQRWWFVALMAVAITATLYLIYRFRVRRLVELERVRTRIATDLHDDIGASLSQIAILSEVARQGVGQGNGPVTKPLSMIAATSRELVDSMSDLVWAINPKRDSVRDLVHRMRRFASDTFTARGIKFHFNAPADVVLPPAGADVRREVFLVFKESVNNIAKHSGCTEAEIDLRVEGGQLSLRLRDNGKGFDVALTSANGDGHGLTSMHERAERIGGRLEIRSTEEGTIVSLTVPLVRRRALWRS